MAYDNPSRAGTAAELGNSVVPFNVDAAAAWAVKQPFIYDRLARQGVGSVPNGVAAVQIVTYGNLAVADTLADGATHTAVALSNTKVTLTPAFYLQSVLLGYQSGPVAGHNPYMVAVNRVVDAYRTKLDTDMLATASSFDSSQGSAATTNDLINFSEAVNSFLALSKYPGERAAVLSNGAMGDLTSDAFSTPAAVMGSGAGAELAKGMASSTEGLIHAEILGTHLYVSDRVAAGDTTGKSNFVVQTGSQAGLAIGYRRNDMIEGVAAMEDRMVPVHAEIVKIGDSPGHFIRAFGYHACGIVEQARCHRFITSA